jgi:hypothetical protein
MVARRRSLRFVHSSLSNLFTIADLLQALVNLLEEKPDASLKDGIYTARRVLVLLIPAFLRRRPKVLSTFYLFIFREAEEQVHNALIECLKLGYPTPPPEFIARWNPQVCFSLSFHSYKQLTLNIFDSCRAVSPS